MKPGNLNPKRQGDKLPQVRERLNGTMAEKYVSEASEYNNKAGSLACDNCPFLSITTTACFIIIISIDYRDGVFIIVSVNSVNIIIINLKCRHNYSGSARLILLSLYNYSHDWLNTHKN